jgi:cytochrome c553
MRPLVRVPSLAGPAQIAKSGAGAPLRVREFLRRVAIVIIRRSLTPSARNSRALRPFSMPSSIRLSIATRLLAAALLGCLAMSSAQAGDAKAGKIKFYTCTGCHGIAGYKNVYPSYKVPRLGGQHAAYLETALKQYRAGERKHPTMQAQGESLSDVDIADIVAYVASVKQPAKPNPGSTDAAKLAQEKCASCHIDGVSKDPQYPNLAGQYRDYMVHALHAYKNKTRATCSGFNSNMRCVRA